MDRKETKNKEIINTVIKKLNRRKKILKNMVKLDKPKIYRMSKRNGKYQEVRPSFRNEFIRSIPNANYREMQNECPECQVINGLYVLKPLYKISYLNDFYDALELTYYSNRDDPTFININNGNVSILFNGLNLYQLIEYSYKLNPALGVYLFRYLVDMIYLLQVPKQLIPDFYMRSKLIIVRYGQGANIQPYVSSIRDQSAVITTMSLGPEVNVYDFVPTGQRTGDSYRVFYRNGSVVIVDGEAKNLWTQNVPSSFVYTNGFRYEIILLAHKYSNATNCYTDIYGNKICNYFNPGYFSA